MLNNTVKQLTNHKVNEQADYIIHVVINRPVARIPAINPMVSHGSLARVSSRTLSVGKPSSEIPEIS